MEGISFLYKHIIFDFDGTLVDSVGVLVDVFNSISDKFGFNKISQNDYRLLNKASLKDKLKILGVPIYRLFRYTGCFLWVDWIMNFLESIRNT